MNPPGLNIKMGFLTAHGIMISQFPVLASYATKI
jgi:hypothetical protein